MLTVTRDDFDSSLLDKAVYRIAPSEVITSENELMEAVPEGTGTITYFFSPFSPPSFEVLARATFCLISVRQTYSLRAIPAVAAGPWAVKWLAEMRDELEPGELANLAALIGESSRYFKDPRIPKE